MGMKAELMIIDHNRSLKMQRGTKAYSGKAIFVFCLASFFGGSLFSSRTFWNTPSDDHFRSDIQPCDHKRVLAEDSYHDQSENNVVKEVAKTHEAIKSLDKTMLTLEKELAATRTLIGIQNMTTTNQAKKEDNEANNNKTPVTSSSPVLVVIGINTAFSSQKRREALRGTWMSAETRKEANEKRVVMRFVIGRSTGGGAEQAEKDLDAESAQHGDFLRLVHHVEAYHRLSAKTKAYFSTALATWPQAEFFVKVDDDVHVNPAALVTSLAKHRHKPRVYVGCMKSGPVLYEKAEKYYEPEFMMFGEKGNNYFRHATGQIYAISNDLASYIAINGPILHKYANEDVSLGAWLIGLDVDHVDERSMCCGTPPDCEWKAEEGNVCVASFEWQCSGVCNSEEQMKIVHAACGEGLGALSSLDQIL